MLIEEIELGTSPEQLFSVLQEKPFSFFLESALDIAGLGQFSFIGLDPFLIFRSRGGVVELTRAGRTEMRRADALAELRQLFRHYRSPGTAAFPFSGGAVGYFSYEFGLQFERIIRSSPDDLDIPDAEFGFYDAVLVCAVQTGRTYIIANSANGESEQTLVQQWKRTIQEARTRGRAASGQRPPAGGAMAELSSNFTQVDYLRAIARIQDYIRAGDVYQVNLSQRFSAPLVCPPYELYGRLRRSSPAPFAAYLNFGDRQVVSSSPERFLRLQDRSVETRPIKGTRRRGADVREDAELSRELVASEKERAELLMIVDLERNDLGRVCEFGSIRVNELYRLEAHPTVFHLVGTVTGMLRPGLDAFDCLRAMLPGGSITGVPKVRAMQIIDELEPHRRHLYSGAIGYLGFDGNCDFNIAIRTILCSRGRVHYHVGGGIVADSDPESEYQETLAKGRAMRAALLGENLT